MFSLVVMTLIILRSFRKFRALVWRLTWNLGLNLGTTPSELNKLGHNHTQVGLCMWLEAYNYMEALSCMWFGVKVCEPQLKVWSPRVVLWLLSVL